MPANRRGVDCPRAAGARLRYHGDFDWPGITIANGIISRFGAQPWRLDNGAYRAAAALGGASLRGNPVTAAWDPRLTEAMLELGVKVEEERVLAADSSYASYRRNVKRRLIPRVY